MRVGLRYFLVMVVSELESVKCMYECMGVDVGWKRRG